MATREPIVTTTFRVGYRYRCTMAVPRFSPGEVLTMAVEWEPKVPSRLSRREMDDYRRGRDTLLAEVADIIGGNVLVLE